MTKERLAVILFSSKCDDSVIYLTDIWLLKALYIAESVQILSHSFIKVMHEFDSTLSNGNLKNRSTIAELTCKII